MKYIMGLINFVFTYIYFVFIKLFHYKTFSFSFPHLFPLNTEIELDKKGLLYLDKKVRAKNGIKMKIRNNAEIKIGENTVFNYNNILVSREKIAIGKNCQFGPNVLIYDHDHDYKSINGVSDMKYKTEPVVIGDNVWIGANVIILRGTKIGNNSVVGAGTVVKGDYPEETLIVQENKMKTMYIGKKSGENEV